MILIALFVVWALVLGVSPGVGLIVGAVGLVVIDRYHPRILDQVAVGR